MQDDPDSPEYNVPERVNWFVTQVQPSNFQAVSVQLAGFGIMKDWLLLARQSLLWVQRQTCHDMDSNLQDPLLQSTHALYKHDTPV